MNAKDQGGACAVEHEEIAQHQSASNTLISSGLGTGRGIAAGLGGTAIGTAVTEGCGEDEGILVGIWTGDRVSMFRAKGLRVCMRDTGDAGER